MDIKYHTGCERAGLYFILLLDIYFIIFSILLSNRRGWVRHLDISVGG